MSPFPACIIHDKRYAIRITNDISQLFSVADANLALVAYSEHNARNRKHHRVSCWKTFNRINDRERNAGSFELVTSCVSQLCCCYPVAFSIEAIALDRDFTRLDFYDLIFHK